MKLSALLVVLVLLVVTLCSESTTVKVELEDNASPLHNIVSSSEVKPNANAHFEHVITQELITQVAELRHQIHKYPEISGDEVNTANKVKDFVSKFHPDATISEIGGSGLVFAFKLDASAAEFQDPVILFRAELDALPLREGNNSVAAKQGYNSHNSGVAHLCGHDGHTAVVAGLASVVRSLDAKYNTLGAEKRLKGTVLLLLQPAEETGQGANSMRNDEKFKTNSLLQRVKHAFALHNLPGYEEGTILLRRGTFSAASKGVQISLLGETSHAAHPEDGRSPALAIAEIIQQLENLSATAATSGKFKDFILITLVHAHLGKGQTPAYGTAAGEGQVMATIRCFQNEDMDTLVQEITHIVKKAASPKKLVTEISFSDEFLATVNEDLAVNIVERAAQSNRFKIQELNVPFRWSEDFGNFQFKGSAFFGIGNGEDCPQLHTPDYDFRDSIIFPCLAMFTKVIEQICLQ